MSLIPYIRSVAASNGLEGPYRCYKCIHLSVCLFIDKNFSYYFWSGGAFSGWEEPHCFDITETTVKVTIAINSFWVSEQ